MAKAKDNSKPRAATSKPLDKAAVNEALDRIAAGLSRFDEEMQDLDRALIIEAVKAEVIPPWWAEKLLKPATAPTLNAKRTRKGKQMARVLLVLPGLYPPDGMPPDSVMTAKVHRQVLKEFKDRGWGEVSRDVVERAIVRRKT